MNIKELLLSSYSVGRGTQMFKKKGINTRLASYTFSEKPFGSVYLQNIVVSYKTEHKIIEIVLVMGTATDKGKSGHRVALALKGVNFTELYSSELVRKIKEVNKSLESLSNNEIIDLILTSNLQPIPNHTIIQKTSTAGKFLLIENNISATTTEVQVRCSCTDFYYTWAYYNGDNNALIGSKPPAYMRKNASLIPIRNRDKRPGLCKHNLLLIAILMKGGLISNLPQLTNSAPALSYNPILSKSDSVVRVFKDVNTNRLAVVKRQDVSKILKSLRDELRDRGQIRRGYNH